MEIVKVTPEALLNTDDEKQFNDAVTILIAKYQQAIHRHRLVLQTVEMAKASCESIGKYFHYPEFDRSTYRGCDTFEDEILRQCWTEIIEKTAARDFMTRKMRNDFEKMMETQSKAEFTRENIRNLIVSLGASRNDILTEAVRNVFEYLTVDTRRNYGRASYATNRGTGVNKKAIIEYAFESRFKKVELLYNRKDEFNDIDRVMAFLNGKKLSDIKTTIVDAIEAFCKTIPWEDMSVPTEPVECDYFLLKWFKKGTLHIEFKDDFTRKEFNRVAANGITALTS